MTEKIERFKKALEILHRSSASLADELGCSKRTCQLWGTSREPPPEVLSWLERQAEAVSRIRPPEIIWRAGTQYVVKKVERDKLW